MLKQDDAVAAVAVIWYSLLNSLHFCPHYLPFRVDEAFFWKKLAYLPYRVRLLLLPVFAPFLDVVRGCTPRILEPRYVALAHHHLICGHGHRQSFCNLPASLAPHLQHL